MGNRERMDIEQILSTMKEIHFDSTIFIFGFGDYLDIIKDHIVEQNRVYIFDLDESSKNMRACELDENISIIKFEEKEISTVLKDAITIFNYMNLYVIEYSDYEEKYKDEYTKFIELLDHNFYRIRIHKNTTKAFNKIELTNTLLNMKHINESSPIDAYISINNNIPAVIVSAGPSLDKNLVDLLEIKDKLDNIFIVAGNRTVSSLMSRGIKPDLIVSIDPQNITYEMLKDYLNLDVPLLYYETSNSLLLDKYKGPKIVTSRGMYGTVEGLENMASCYVGGSVAHSSTDIAVALGCNPIIFLGQDFAFTYEKEHAIYSTHSLDKDNGKFTGNLFTKDVWGNDVKTTPLFNLYRDNMERYIEIYSNEGVQFYNCSYGADIKGATHKELLDIVKESKFNIKKVALQPQKIFNIDVDKINIDIVENIEKHEKKIDELLAYCKYITTNAYEDPINDAIVIKHVLDFIVEFFNDTKNLAFEAYLEEFLVEVQVKYFTIDAKDVKVKSEDMKYQGEVFTKYLKDLKELLKEIKEVIKEIL